MSTKLKKLGNNSLSPREAVDLLAIAIKITASIRLKRDSYRLM
ncbi:conserved hypothetical protein [Pseudoalteromonas sp. 3J6]|nr:conserved hypothetical protein [Pseudoalteromonas sp. 3J6]